MKFVQKLQFFFLNNETTNKKIRFFIHNILYYIKHWWIREVIVRVESQKNEQRWKTKYYIKKKTFFCLSVRFSSRLTGNRSYAIHLIIYLVVCCTFLESLNSAHLLRACVWTIRNVSMRQTKSSKKKNIIIL